MQKKNRYLSYCIFYSCLLLIVIGIYVSGYNPPTQGPPFGNLPAPINASLDEQTKAGNLTIEGNLTTKGILKLGQFTTANLPAGVEGALCFDTDKNSVQVYTSGSWKDLAATTLALGETCNSDGDCDSTNCVDGVCCDFACDGSCESCNVAGSLGICTEVASDCIGDCNVCSSGNCIADPTKCTGNCVQCTGSGTDYSCSAKLGVCTGNCSFCNGSGTEYNCVGSNGFCSNTLASCGCVGSGTVFNCQSCTDDPYGVCGYPICSDYSCSQAYNNGVYCAYNGHDNDATNYYCSSGSCLCTSSSYTTSPDGKDNDCDGTVDEKTSTCVDTGSSCHLKCNDGYSHYFCWDACTQSKCDSNCSYHGGCLSNTYWASCCREYIYKYY